MHKEKKKHKISAYHDTVISKYALFYPKKTELVSVQNLCSQCYRQKTLINEILSNTTETYS